MKKKIEILKKNLLRLQILFATRFCNSINPSTLAPIGFWLISSLSEYPEG